MVRNNLPFIPDYYETYVREQNNSSKLILTKNNEVEQGSYLVLSDTNFLREPDLKTITWQDTCSLSHFLTFLSLD